jgi:hypothetical protein
MDLSVQYTANEKLKNYDFIIQTIHDLEHNLFEEYWISDHIDRIALYRLWFCEDLGKVNPEIQDEKFRSVAENAEHLLQKLIIDIERTSSIEPDEYLEFNQCLKWLTEFTLQDDEDFTEMFAKMSMGNQQQLKNETCMDIE